MAHNRLGFEIVVATLLPVFGVSGVLAQVDSISLQQATELALKQNQIVAVADLDVQQSASHLREVQSARYPQLSLRSHYLCAPDYGYSDIVTNGGEYGLQLGAGIPLYDGGVRSTTIHQASNAIDRSSVALQKTKAELMFDVRSAYYELAHTLNELRIRKETVGRLTDYVSFLTRLQQGGGAGAGDVLKARVELSKAATELESAHRLVRKGMLELNKLIGNPLEKEIRITENEPADTSALPVFSIENNYSLRLLKHDEISASDNVSIARSERLPTLTIAGDVGFLGVQPNEYRNNLGFSLFLSFEFPLLSWGGIENRIQQQEISHQQIEKQLELQKRDLETQWRTTLSNIAYERSALSAYAGNIGEAEKNYLLAKSSFAGGAGSNLEVLDAQRFLVDAKLDYNNTLYALNSSLANALKLSGQ